MAGHQPARAIDIGCGTGTNVISLARAGWQVTGVDFAPRAIQIARQKVKKAGVPARLLVQDATRLQGVNGPFELALDLGCFHGMPPGRQDKYLDQLERVLASGGFWLMYGFLKLHEDQNGTGLAQADLDRIASRLTLRSRRDGVDDGRSRPSAWFLYQKQ
jgi:ubiquinone/menaquinone biosynthesis C-methylase UbiE